SLGRGFLSLLSFLAAAVVPAALVVVAAAAFLVVMSYTRPRPPDVEGPGQTQPPPPLPPGGYRGATEPIEQLIRSGDERAAWGNYLLAREYYERAQSECVSVLQLMGERPPLFRDRERNEVADLKDVVATRLAFCRLALAAQELTILADRRQPPKK